MSWAWWYTSATPEPKRWRQEDGEFEDSLSYMARCCHKKKKKKLKKKKSLR
jgi:hypothetical protein